MIARGRVVLCGGRVPRVLGPCLLLCLAGCASPDRITLLPEADGQVGTLAVLDDAGGEALVITGPYQSVSVSQEGAIDSIEDSAGRIQEDFAEALAAQPPAPTSHMLYFEPDTTILTPESHALTREILASIVSRPAADVLVIGHTDRQASERYNDQLSLARAAAVRETLVELGLEPARITIAGRGEREPAVPTEDGVAEPRNRRVEISVR